MEDQKQLSRNDENEGKVSFSDSDFDQDFKVDPLTAMDMLIDHKEEQEAVHKSKLAERKEEEEAALEKQKAAKEEAEYAKFKDRFSKEKGSGSQEPVS